MRILPHHLVAVFAIGTVLGWSVTVERCTMKMAREPFDLVLASTALVFQALRVLVLVGQAQGEAVDGAGA